ncbi:hypothetical protein [Mesorhizobium sp.]|uniref:hypothetical protein n=1 Tax=Mesorhizobium sp. TaxID=1871066 RepID=UPI000FE3FC3A|nr:hypothetical protein [Mesorhizobium sp.]RWH49581.1 MAG: hypothetical protein EOQ80_06650 [Mesorhizobium sp.]RWH52181.1 MAG: hypothetical protein EOQ82_27255 [Mesorhizobium sp.]RWI48387.1 MAG: hypothetical protein EOR15_13575 [Mesorhizobium sp.]RWI64036.1 MAG: hypothetical protein EOR18_30245 [Mesorhizobium sp.]RWI74813.1 MAG: hypothetical protein EOR19_20225 [Mesorhizobium sp.]
MGFPAPFVGSRPIGAPAGRDDILPAHFFTNGNFVVSAWQLTPEEVAVINHNGGKIFVAVGTGKDFYPTLVGSSESIRMMLIDYGGTFPSQPVEVIA